MITFEIIGLDQYTIGHYSKDNNKNLANLFETSEDELCFYAPNAYLFHNGVEQTSWQTLVKVFAPQKYDVFQDKIADYLLKTLKNFSINVAVEFYYYDEDNRYEYHNEEYPLYIKSENVVNVEEDELKEGEELYEGNIFENFQEQLEEIYQGEGVHGEEEDECDCGHHHHH
ncbi:MAG: hypothetical protein K6E11_04005 [Bacilli bacterium]|nr:hypothetical protein [Bacilli bacterium]